MSDFVLFLHVASAMLLMGGTAATRLAESAVRAAADLATLRGALGVLQRMSQFNPALALVLLATGAWLGRHGVWATPWYLVAVATWFANLFLVTRFVVPHGKALAMAAGRAGEGPIPAAVDAQRNAGAPAYAHDAMIGLDIGTLLIMVVKPGIEWSLIAPLLGVVLMVAIRFVGPMSGGVTRHPATGSSATRR